MAEILLYEVILKVGNGVEDQDYFNFKDNGLTLFLGVGNKG